VGRPGDHGGQGVGGGQTQVVVGVHFNIEIARCLDLADALQHPDGLQNSDRVGIAEAISSRRLGRFDHLQQKVGIGAGGILTAEADLEPHGAGLGDDPGDAAQHRLPRDAQFGVDLLIRNRDREVDPVDGKSGASGQIALVHAAPDLEFGAQGQVGDGPN